MAETNNGQGESRLDRMERILEMLIDDHLKFTDEHKRLLTAQILLAEAERRTEERLQKLAADIAELRESQKETDERLNALIAVVDGLIHRPKQD